VGTQGGVPRRLPGRPPARGRTPGSTTSSPPSSAHSCAPSKHSPRASSAVTLSFCRRRHGASAARLAVGPDRERPRRPSST
jgi:hypothetical protein